MDMVLLKLDFRIFWKVIDVKISKNIPGGLNIPGTFFDTTLFDN